MTEVPNAHENDYRMKSKTLTTNITNKSINSALVKIRKKDFCVVLAGKQQKCRDRAALSFDSGNDYAGESDIITGLTRSHFVPVR